MFFLSLTLLAMALAVSASPAQRRQLEDGATCSYHLIPQTEADGINLVAEMNYAIGREIAIETNGAINGGGMSPEPHLDGSVTATGTIVSAVLSGEELKALVTSWPEKGTVLTGAPQNGFLQWNVDTVTCE